ncbi:MAG: HAD family phosphatase [Clostridium sp.]|nr:HAD family phosphatase [Clostridium sp.]
MIKIIASDMDGTLLNKKHKISDENLKAIKEAQDKGIHFAIATGRDYLDVKPVLEEYNLRCECIVSNGAEYRDCDGNIIETVNIDKKILRQIFNIMNKFGIKAQVFTSDGIYTPNTKEDALKGFAQMIQNFYKIESFEQCLESAKNDPRFGRLKYISECEDFYEGTIEVRKIFAFHKSVETINKARVEIEKIDGLAVSSSFVDNIEITNKDAQKGIILAKVADKMEIKKEEVMIMGDSFNDYSMFTEFTETVAMENAIPEIKKIAKYITDTNDNDGVAKAIRKVLV